MTVRIVSRESVSGFDTTVTLLLSLLAGLGAISLLLLLAGQDPLFALARIFKGSFGSVYGFKETVTKAIPLILIGTGLAMVFRGRFWNIGAEGQLLMGAILATWVGLEWAPGLPAVVAIPLVYAAGFAGGALWGILPAVLKVRLAINEVISTLMLNYICAEILTMLITGPWKGETKFGFPYTDNLPPSAVLALIPGSRIHYLTLILALLAAVILCGC
jgi:ABC-type uncharacterized transport system permease subunit